jgi:LL-diaminopimelate aminotransferase
MSERQVRAARLRALPPYLFVEIDRKRRLKMAAGADVINLGVGDPDRPTPEFIIAAMNRAMREPVHHQYPPSNGTAEFRAAAARFMQRRFGVKADPDRHILACIGTKEGIGHLPLAVVDPGDVVLIPRPCYPVYVAGATFAHAEIHELPTSDETGWRPVLDGIPEGVARRAKLMWANYPNNPTGASADLDFFNRWVEFCTRHRIIAASDLAYSEVFFEQAPFSMWQARAAVLDETLGIEFHSLSKTFNMTGWRIGFAVGHPELISALSAVKGNMDSGQFGAIQSAGAAALDHTDHADVVAMREVYRQRRDALIPGLREIGCHVEPPRAGFFVWARCPMIEHRPGSGKGVLMDSMEFAGRALEEANVVVVPGAGFAEEARHYFRVALTVEVPRLREAVERLKRIDWSR